MALKKKLTKEEHAKLSEAIKSEYIEDGDGFRLDVDGDEDIGALKRAKDREAQLRREAEAKLREAQEELSKLSDDDARKKGDIATLEKSWAKNWGEKLQAEKSAHEAAMLEQKTNYEAQLNKFISHTKTQLIDNVAMQIASEISTSPAVMMPHIKARLQADLEGDVPATRILSQDGKMSNMTAKELAAEFVANKDFSAIIKAPTKASGGAGSSSSRSNGGAINQADPTIDLASMNPAALAAHIKASKTTD